MGIEIGLAVAALSAGYGVYSGEQANAAQKKGIRRQTDAQNEAKAAALSTKKLNDMAAAKATPNLPDPSGLLGAESEATRAGVASTLLSQQDPNKLRNGRSLLGG
jgi:hypothetical protein